MADKRRNQLGNTKHYALCEWIKGQWEVFKRDALKPDEAAKKATVDLGFYVTTYNLNGALKTLGRGWPGRRQVGVVNGKPSKLAKLEARVATLEGQVERLMEIVTRPGQQLKLVQEDGQAEA